jgi:hypothetical protein
MRLALDKNLEDIVLLGVYFQSLNKPMKPLPPISSLSMDH